MKLNYAKYDFDDLLTQLQGIMQSTGSWDTFKSGTGQMLLELYAYVGTLAGYYTERRAEEGYLLTARNRSSLLNLAALVGYQPKLRTSAVYTLPSPPPVTPNVVMSVAVGLPSDVFIPRGTQLQTSNGLNFYVTANATLLAGTTSVGVSVIQGTLQTRTPVTPTGAAGFSITLTDANIEATPPTVTVYAGSSGVQWTWINSFKGYSPADKVFKTQVNPDDSVTVLFGDGVRGAIPPSSSYVTVEYTISDGVSGNLVSGGALTTVVTPFLTSGLVPVPVTMHVTNNAAITGGAEKDTNLQIQDEAPALFMTGDRAVTTLDCHTIANSVTNVVDSIFQGEYDLAVLANPTSPSPDRSKMNTVQFSLITQNTPGIPVSPDNIADSTAAQVVNVLRSKGMMSVLYTYQKAGILTTVLQLRIQSAPTVNLSNLYATAIGILKGEFNLGTTSMLGLSKYRSVLTRDIQNLVGVNSVHLDIFTELVLTAGAASPTTVASTVFTADPTTSRKILPGGVKIYLSTTAGVAPVLAATDNGVVASPAFTWVAPFTSGYSATLSYTTGTVVITHTGGIPAGGGYVLVQQDNTDVSLNGDLILTPTQLATLDPIYGIQFL